MQQSAVAAVVLVTAMTAWHAVSGETNTFDPRLQQVLPTDTTPALMASDAQPAGTRFGEGRFFSMYVPASFRMASTRMPSGEQMVTFDAPSSNPATPVRSSTGRPGSGVREMHTPAFSQAVSTRHTD